MTVEISRRWSLLGGVSGGRVSLHTNWWGNCFPATAVTFNTRLYFLSSLFSLIFKNFILRPAEAFKDTLTVTLWSKLVPWIHSGAAGMVVQWKVENREGKGGEPGEGRGQWLLFPPMFLSQLCNEGEMLTGRADQEGGHCLSTLMWANWNNWVKMSKMAQNKHLKMFAWLLYLHRYSMNKCLLHEWFGSLFANIKQTLGLKIPEPEWF